MNYDEAQSLTNDVSAMVNVRVLAGTSHHRHLFLLCTFTPVFTGSKSALSKRWARSFTHDSKCKAFVGIFGLFSRQLDGITGRTRVCFDVSFLDSG